MNPKPIIEIALLALLLSGYSLPGAAFAQTKSQKIDTLLTLCSSADQFNGTALVVDEGRVIYRKSFGYANLEWKIPNTPETKFRIGSITKSFTAILVLQLAEQGKIKLDGTISDYLPDFPKRLGQQITIDQLLTHTSGLPDINDVPDFFRMVQSGLLTQEDILKRIGTYDLKFPPGTNFKYSNDGYEILGAIIEKITGKSYEQALQESILRPLKMVGSGYSSRNLIIEKRAYGYRKRLDRYEIPLYYVESPASGMYSTVDDLFLWEQALYTNSLLSEKYKTLMWALSPHGNAYGWLVSKKTIQPGRLPVLFVVSEGAIPGFFAWTARLPERNQLIVLLTNIRAPTNYLPDINQAITNILYDQPYQPPKKSIAETLLMTFERRGIKAVIEQYKTLKTNQSSSYSFAQNELDSLGYRLLDLGEFPASIQVFKLNVEAYPQSFNTYDSLAEAYMRSGDIQRAIANYEKSIELNPQNANGIEMLKKLKVKSP